MAMGHLGGGHSIDNEHMRKHGFMKSQRGFSLIDVALGILVLAILSVAFLMAVRTATKANNQANVRTTATSLADGLMEAIKIGPYSVAEGVTGNYTVSTSLITVPGGYRFATLDNSNTITAGRVYGMSWDVASDARWAKTTPADPGIQKVTIIVESNNSQYSGGSYKEVFRLVDFKVNR
jgi:Tfp pilus assembly protein PilV